jgi:hypothetical protein
MKLVSAMSEIKWIPDKKIRESIIFFQKPLDFSAFMCYTIFVVIFCFDFTERRVTYAES